MQQSNILICLDPDGRIQTDGVQADLLEDLSHIQGIGNPVIFLAPSSVTVQGFLTGQYFPRIDQEFNFVA